MLTNLTMMIGKAAIEKLRAAMSFAAPWAEIAGATVVCAGMVVDSLPVVCAAVGVALVCVALDKGAHRA